MRSAPTGGVENLPWMYTGTLIGMLIANALYAVIVARMSRRRFIPIAYRFAIANLFVFFLLMRWMPAAQERAILAPIFFIWVSVFNLFATTMFWSFMADVFTPDARQTTFRVYCRRRLDRRNRWWSCHELARRKAQHRPVSPHHSGHVGDCCAMCAPISRPIFGRMTSKVSNQSAANSGKARRTLLDLPTYLV